MTLPLVEVSLGLVAALLMEEVLHWSASQVLYCHELS